VASEGIGGEKYLRCLALDHALTVRTKLLGPMSGPTLLVLIRKSINYIRLDINLLVEDHHDGSKEKNI
jgi:hypothetical protein